MLRKFNSQENRKHRAEKLQFNIGNRIVSFETDLSIQ